MTIASAPRLAAVLPDRIVRDLREPRIDPASPEALTPADCLSHLGTGGFGHLALEDETGIVISPLPYTIWRGALLLRTDDTLADRLAAPLHVAFETSGQRRGQLWSVVVRGSARRLSPETGLRRVVRLQPQELIGMRFALRG